MSSTTIVAITHWYAGCAYTSIFVIGFIGNCCNIFLFVSVKQFRVCPGAWYIIAESIANELLMFVGLAPRMIAEVFNFDPFRTSIIWCKIRNPLTQYCTLMGLSMVTFAAFDQYLSTSCDARYRRMSTTQLAKRFIDLIATIFLPYCIVFVIFFDIQLPSGCLLKNATLSRYYSFFHLLVLNGLLPVLISMVFSILAYRNVRRIHRRHMTDVRRRLDHQMTAMILVRVALLVVCLVPSIAQRFYNANVQSDPKDLLRTAIEQLIGSINISISYLHVSVGSAFVVD